MDKSMNKYKCNTKESTRSHVTKLNDQNENLACQMKTLGHRCTQGTLVACCCKATVNAIIKAHRGHVADADGLHLAGFKFIHKFCKPPCLHVNDHNKNRVQYVYGWSRWRLF